AQFIDAPPDKILMADTIKLVEQMMNNCQNDNIRKQAIFFIAERQTNFSALPKFICDIFYQVYISFSNISRQLPPETKQKIFRLMMRVGMQYHISQLQAKWH
ncbi:MAG: hypothetical protein ACR2PV_05790, partial [Gammaproteobacteria bacterium]